MVITKNDYAKEILNLAKVTPEHKQYKVALSRLNQNLKYNLISGHNACKTARQAKGVIYILTGIEFK